MTALDAGPIKAGDRLLVRYMARCATGATGAATAKLQLAEPPHSLLGVTDRAQFGGEWQQINLPLIATLGAEQGRAQLALFFGAQIQTVEVAAIQVLNFGPDFDLAKLPRQNVTYPGRDDEAAWRTAALTRIAAHRMADYSVQLLDAQDKPLVGKTVTVDLDRHEFGFGSCVTADMLTKEGPASDRYREIVARTFSRVVFENDLKPWSFPRSADGRAKLEKSFAWLAARGIGVRGHFLVQEALDKWSRKRLGDPDKLREEMLADVRERITAVGPRVTEWDAINHPVAWRGADLLAKQDPRLATLSMDVFHAARSATNLPLCINEDQLFRPGPQQDLTFEFLANLKRRGVRVDGLGNQAHISSSFLPSPEDILRVTERFTAVVPKQVITEFDILTNGDEQLAADYLRDILIACFSHPAYDGFLLWGFWESTAGLAESYLWRNDWTLTPAGRVWEEWVGKRWHTRETLTTDAAGRVSWRGFKGSYCLTADGQATPRFQPGTPAAPASINLP
jgi:GH35 family endo-1,4-beta-xylanase